MWWALLACTNPRPIADSALLPTVYWVDMHTDPAAPIAGEQATVWLTVHGTDGPVQDLQVSHTRFVHTFIISKDLQSFQHTHEEDYQALTADEIRTATFHYPETFPYAGSFLFYFDYATQDQYYNSIAWQEVGGSPAQLDQPIVDLSRDKDDGDVHAELVFDAPPSVQSVSDFHVHLTTSDGADVTDVVQWLGADAHVAMCDTHLVFVAHTHAWFDGMSTMPPDHEMPHLYDGPDIPFEYQFPIPGIYKIWIQFARAENPDVPYTIPFMFGVGP